jgi:hypothetical protein
MPEVEVVEVGDADVKFIGRRLCPRCSFPFKSLAGVTIGGNTYYVAKHVVYIEGQRIPVWYCYLGPNEYIYVTTLHEDLDLTLRGAIEEGRWVEYIERIINSVLEKARKSEDKGKFIDGMIRVREIVMKAFRELVKPPHKDVGQAD